MMLNLVATVLPTAFVLPHMPPHMGGAATTAVSHATALVAAAADPFADPVFTGSVQETVEHHASLPGAIFQGLACYVVSMYLLSKWEEHVMPVLQERGILLKAKTREAIKWLTPLTADNRVPLPLPAEIEEACIRIGGGSDGAHQYICDKSLEAAVSQTAAAPELGDFDACEISDGFSSYYGKPIVICHRQVR